MYNTDICLQLIEKYPGDEVILPFYYFDIMKKPEIHIGKISIRIGDNFHSYYNGHVGFEIFEKFRGNNYAYQATLLILDIAKSEGMNRLYLTCTESNGASRRIFEKLGADFVEIATIPKECFFYKDGIEDYAIYMLGLSSSV